MVSRRALIVALVALTLSACTLLIGLPDLPSEAADASGDGSLPDGDAGLQDVGMQDGALDVAADVRTLVVLASGQATPEGLAVGSDVYWANLGGTVMKCAIGGCGGAPTTFASGFNNSNAIAINSKDAYWTDITGIWTCPLAGCPDAGASLFSNEALAIGIALDGTRQYSTCDVDGGAIVKCNLAGCGNRGDLVSGEGNLVNVATDGVNVYWTTIGTGGNLYKCPVTGCGGTPAILASAGGAPFGVATDGTNVYWTDTSAGTVSMCAVGGCSQSPTVLASNQPFPVGIAVDATNVYWTNENPATGTVATCAITGCSNKPTVLAGNQDQPRAVAVDSTSVYWTNVSGTVMKLTPK